MSLVLRQAGALDLVSPSRWKGCSRAESGQARKRQAVLVGWLASLLGGLSPSAAPPVLLVGAVGLFAAAPAEAQVTILSGTLTVDKAGNDFGCDNIYVSLDNCSTATVLTDGDFVYKGTTYLIDHLYWQSSTNRLFISFDKGVGFSQTGAKSKTTLSGFTVNVQDNAFAINSASITGDSLYWTYDPATDWTDNLEVSVSVTRPAATDATLSGLTATSSTSASGSFTSLNIGTFAAATSSYAAFSTTATHVKLTPTVNDSNAKVKVGKQGATLTAVTSGNASGAIALNSQGATAITVEVTAEDGTTKKTYTVTVRRIGTHQLSGLSVTVPGKSYGSGYLHERKNLVLNKGASNQRTITPGSSGLTWQPEVTLPGGFKHGTTAYNITVPHDATELNVTATWGGSSAVVKVGSNNSGVRY